jgi:predicted permease
MDGVGAVSWAPLTSNILMGTYQIEGVGEMPPRSFIDKMAVTPGYFGTLGIARLHGREFTAADRADAAGVVIVSRSIAERFWPPDGAGAIGERLTGEDEPRPEDWLTIVGVVDDVVQTGLTEERRSAMYTPVLQTEGTFFLRSMTYVVRTRQNPESVMQPMRDAVSAVDPNLPVSALRTMNDMVAENLSEPRFEATLLAVFAAIALLLAAIGTYGVVAFDVVSRTHEIGLRVALGAERRSILGMVLGRAATVAGIGTLLGLAGALALTRVLEGSLFEVTPFDPVTFVAVCVTLLLVALVAAAVPARRATSLDPLIALRQE